MPDCTIIRKPALHVNIQVKDTEGSKGSKGREKKSSFESEYIGCNVEARFCSCFSIHHPLYFYIFSILVTQLAYLVTVCPVRWTFEVKSQHLRFVSI